MGIVSSESIYLLAFHRLPGLGSIYIMQAVEYFGSAERAWLSPAAEWKALPGIGSKRCEILQHRQKIDPYVLAKEVRNRGLDFTTIADETYPAGLRAIHQPPICLFFRGDIRCLTERPCVAVVGTRRASPGGRAFARRMARDLAWAGAVVVSGLARGIDTAAHEGAMQCEEGAVTATVLGGGVDTVYPPENRLLLREIAMRGVVVSEYFPGDMPSPGNFPARNRILSGLCPAVVVVEAGEKSGALITAQMALDEGREVFAVPRDPWSPGSAGVNALLKEGAAIATSASDVLAYLGLRAGGAQPELTPDEGKILQLIRKAAYDMETLSLLSGIPIDRISVSLLQMELKGAVLRMEGGRFIAAV